MKCAPFAPLLPHFSEAPPASLPLQFPKIAVSLPPKFTYRFIIKSSTTMSKGNIFMGQSRGKLGDVVQYRAGGQQRQRGYNGTNTSKSYGQQAQRSRLKSAYNYYKNLKAVVNTGFVAGSAETSPYNRFMAKAMPIAPYLVKQAAEVGNVIPAPFVLSEGILPFPFSVNAPTYEDPITFEVGTLPGPTPTVGDLYAAFIAAAPCLSGKNLKLNAVNIKFTEDTVNGGFKPAYTVVSVPMTSGSTTTLTAAGLSYSEGDVSVTGTDADSLDAQALFIAEDDGGAITASSYAALGLTSTAMTAYASSITKDAARAAAESYGVDGGSCTL